MTPSLVLSGLLSLLAASETPPGDVADAVPATPVQDEEAPADEGPEFPKWGGTVDIGIVQKQGNAESINGTLNSNIVGEYEKSRTTITTWWIYEENGGSLVERRYGTRGKYDWFLTEKKKNYLFGQGQVGTDFSANVEIRYFAGGGVGWVWSDTEKFRLSTDLGANYLIEDFRDGTDDERGNYTFGYDVDWSLYEKTNYESQFLGQMGMSDSDDVLVQWFHSLIWEFGDLRTGLRYTLNWDNTPAAGSKRDDHVIAFVLGWSFGQTE